MMPKIDDVIERLEYSKKTMHNGYVFKLVRPDIVNDAIELLKEQKPVYPRLGHVDEGLWICGNCDVAIFPHGTHYCHNCGRKVKWE